ncbi:MAG: cysteine desulfurase family protein [Oscillospiraceae bacterium]|nr:cysteine desulfurase family protein [Oscillospiraceae bacterium]
MFYFDNSATTQVDPQVIEEISAVMAQHFANPSSLYTPGAKSEQVMNNARAAVAAAMGCGAGEVVFTACGSESNNIAILGALRARQNWANNIVCTGYEHPSVNNVMQRLEKEGWTVNFVNPNENGVVDTEKMLARVNEKTALVCAMHVNNEIGTIIDVAALAEQVKQKNSRTAVHVDGVQAFLKLPTALAATKIDSYAVSGHKVHAPKGIAALYLRKNYHIDPPFLGGGQERGLRPGTENVPYIAGFAKACSLMQPCIAQNAAKMQALNAQLRQGLAAISRASVNSPSDALPYILNVSFDKVRSETLLHYLEARDIYVSSGSACSKGAASHTLAAMGLSNMRRDSALRISMGDTTTPQAVDALLAALTEGCEKLAKVRR